MKKGNRKEQNRIYLRRVFRVKSWFYPLILFLGKTGLSGFLEPVLTRIVKATGINKNVHYFYKYRDYARWFTGVFKKRGRDNGIVLFPMMFGVHSNFTLLNLLLSQYFSEKDKLSPLFYICDSAFSICTKDGLLKSRDSYPWFCHECWSGYRYIESKTGVETVRMNEMLADNDSLLAREEIVIKNLRDVSQCSGYVFDAIPLGVMARKSVLRYFLVGSLPDTAETMEIFHRFLLSGVRYSIGFSKLMDERKDIKYVILNNGTLLFEAIAAEHCRRRSVPFMTYETFIGNNSIIYRKNGQVMEFNWEREYSAFCREKVALGTLRKDVDDFFEGLKRGTGMYALLNRDHDETKMKGIIRYATLFTNLNYDTAVLDRNHIFRNMEEWIFNVIDFWRNSVRDITLVIRIHPGELKLVTASREFLGDRIRKAIGDSENIIVFDAGDKINSYELINGMEYGLIYSSTIGLEIAHAGKPCVVAGLPWFRNKPFVLFPQTRVEYFSQLEEINGGKISFKPDFDELYRSVWFIYFNRIKRLNGIKMHTPREEPNTVFSEPEAMIRENAEFFMQFRDELMNPDL